MRLFGNTCRRTGADRHICATTGSSERPRPDNGGIGYAVLI